VSFHASRRLVGGALIALALLSPALAQQRQQSGESRSSAPAGSVLSLLPADSVTDHALTIGERTLDYAATAGTFSLFDQNGQRSAAIFYTAYAARGAATEARPVTFVFNGGPGAASAYLHLGLIGPQIADFGSGDGAAAARLRDNPESWLAFTDLVFIDPVGAGWSRAAQPDKARDFWSVSSDADSIAKVIALYVAKNGRASSPKYLVGESYGGFRAAKVALALQSQQGLLISGVVMLSPFLEAGLHGGASRFALNAALQLPSMAAGELDRSGRFTPDALAAAERFAMTDYLVAMAGRPPEGDAGRAFYERVAALTGLSRDIVARARGFVGGVYAKQTSGTGEIVSAYDASFAAPDPFPDSLSDEGRDPVLDGFAQALGGLFVDYARNRLGFKTDMTFNLLNGEVNGAWNWGRGGRAQASVTRDLRQLLALNPRLRLLVAHGRSDLVTPYMASRYIFDHMPDIGGPNRRTLTLYRGGHMFYFNADARAAFATDVKTFYRATGS